MDCEGSNGEFSGLKWRLYTSHKQKKCIWMLDLMGFRRERLFPHRLPMGTEAQCKHLKCSH